MEAYEVVSNINLIFNIKRFNGLQNKSLKVWFHYKFGSLLEKQCHSKALENYSTTLNALFDQYYYKSLLSLLTVKKLHFFNKVIMKVVLGNLFFYYPV